MESMEDHRAYRHQQRKVRRRLMETQSGAEVRRLHIVYFLSRKGCTEHPHLIRVHHLSNSGVRLRDIKRWLGELRGKDMPESFAWSYKRRYKTGYVWQDLVDDDLVTPISDNEYVLQGSEISSITNNTDFSYSDQEIPMQQKDQSSLQSHSSDTSSIINVSTKPSSKIKESSPTFCSQTSTLTDDDSGQKLDQLDKKSDTINQSEASCSTHRGTVVLNKKNKKNKRKADKVNEKSVTTSCSNGASHLFRNLINCGGVDTKDSAVVITNKKQSGNFSNMCLSNRRNFHLEKTCKKEKLGGSDQWSNSKGCDGVKDSAKRKGKHREGRASCAAYKPLKGPNCSQCGKAFKPEKLHAHMKSCKGMKALAKPSNSATFAADNKSQISTEPRNGNSFSGYFLTQ